MADDFWQYFWMLVLIFLFTAYLLIFFNILVDLFLRDHKTSGWAKAIWVIFLILVPYLTALAYLTARGHGMTTRARDADMAAKRSTEEYIRQLSGRSPSQEIADAKALLDAGTISQAEFDSLKSKALQ